MSVSLSNVFFSGLLALFLNQWISLRGVSAFSAARSDNLAVYWGQDSAGHQERLSFYCEDDTIDIIPLAFLPSFFDKGGLPTLDFANICSSRGSGAFPGTNLADCAFLAEDIQKCQDKGKIILLSLGGAIANVGFISNAQAEVFAELIWDTFLGGINLIRPFGSAILDGIDLDIESGSAAHYASFARRIRSLAKGADKQYYLSAAPQCPFPDRKIGEALNNAPFDFVFVQFYNNYCEVSAPSKFNFDTWDKWARNESPNPNVKVFLGAPASPDAASQGYVDAETLSRIARDAKKRYSSFGGVMLWDADTAYHNHRYDVAIKKAIGGAGGGPPLTPSNGRVNSGGGSASTTDPRTSSKVRPPAPCPNGNTVQVERNSRFFRSQ
ncbi:hypothetical protein AX17_000428 [Amanita inopinata Kibby_2008]|nr:hypothetical protein AX17_000428 [Amanita inopinata Kibby_2008]